MNHSLFEREVRMRLTEASLKMTETGQLPSCGLEYWKEVEARIRAEVAENFTQEKGQI